VTLRVLIGGARAGKSRLAVELAGRWPGPVAYVATAEERDDEMASRIEQHRRERPPSWRTVEEPLLLRSTVEALAEDEAAVLDCLTLWVANRLERDEPDGIVAEAVGTAAAAAARAAPVIVVTNEVGLGIVPANELARAYRDVLGEVNRVFVAQAQEAALVVAGKALRLEEIE
jgi:adenosyl cobinamide kinase/adenosyl cobinamide phosphate guanylyltransferase